MGEAFFVAGSQVGETVRFAGALGEPRCGEDAREECLEGRHAAANYANFELDAPVQGRMSVWIEWMRAGGKLTPRGGHPDSTTSRR